MTAVPNRDQKVTVRDKRMAIYTQSGSGEPAKDWQGGSKGAPAIRLISDSGSGRRRSHSLYLGRSFLSAAGT